MSAVLSAVEAVAARRARRVELLLGVLVDAVMAGDVVRAELALAEALVLIPPSPGAGARAWAEVERLVLADLPDRLGTVQGERRAAGLRTAAGLLPAGRSS